MDDWAEGFCNLHCLTGTLSCGNDVREAAATEEVALHQVVVLCLSLLHRHLHLTSSALQSLLQGREAALRVHDGRDGGVTGVVQGSTLLGLRMTEHLGE